VLELLLLMYCSPRLTMYGCTCADTASRLPGSIVSPSSPSAFTAGAADAERFAAIIVAVAAVALSQRRTQRLLRLDRRLTPGAGHSWQRFFGAATVLRVCAPLP